MEKIVLLHKNFTGGENVKQVFLKKIYILFNKTLNKVFCCSDSKFISLR